MDRTSDQPQFKLSLLHSTYFFKNSTAAGELEAAEFRLNKG
jgi:hypothetical protein